MVSSCRLQTSSLWLPLKVYNLLVPTLLWTCNPGEKKPPSLSAVIPSRAPPTCWSAGRWSDGPEAAPAPMGSSPARTESSGPGSVVATESCPSWCPSGYSGWHRAACMDIQGSYRQKLSLCVFFFHSNETTADNVNNISVLHAACDHRHG